MTIAFAVDADLRDALTALARDLQLSRADLCRRLLRGVLRNRNAIDRWKDTVLGPRFEFMEVEHGD